MRFLFLAICLTANSIVSSQIWLPVGNGTDNGLGGGILLETYQGKLFALGAFANAGEVNAKGIAYWDGMEWNIVDTNMNIFFSGHRLIVFQDYLYAFMEFYVDSVALMRLDHNFNWQSVPNTEVKYANGHAGVINCMAIFNDDLYVGGRFDKIGGTNAQNIARWDGISWHPVGPGLNEKAIHMEVFNNELYVSGQFTYAGGQYAKKLARWDGSQWNPVGTGLEQGNFITCMKTYKGKLYLGGLFTQMGGQATTNIAVWDGNQFAPVGNGMGDPNSSDFVTGFGIFQDRLYVGGYFGPNDGIFMNEGGVWDGNQWDSLPRGLSSGANDFEYYDCRLYAGGSFTGNINGVAMLDVYDCTMDVAETPTQKETPAIFPNPTQGHISISHGSDILGVEIFDWAGKKLSEKYSETTSQNHSFDLSPYPPGMYTVRIIFEHGTYAAKAIRQ